MTVILAVQTGRKETTKTIFPLPSRRAPRFLANNPPRRARELRPRLDSITGPRPYRASASQSGVNSRQARHASFAFSRTPNQAETLFTRSYFVALFAFALFRRAPVGRPLAPRRLPAVCPSRLDMTLDSLANGPAASGFSGRRRHGREMDDLAMLALSLFSSQGSPLARKSLPAASSPSNPGLTTKRISRERRPDATLVEAVGRHATPWTGTWQLEWTPYTSATCDNKSRLCRPHTHSAASPKMTERTRPDEWGPGR
ncbi:hypothetical protein IWX49DRAFT_552106 [Phyllosticta citricarpa]|uniref:Uncharacterized protein n=2 Tax=Phyllosticta TaxID=121621 RepID=A0ABR1MJ59_9PEZI